MSSVEIFVVIVGAFAGYLLVSHLLRPKANGATLSGKASQEAKGEKPIDVPASWESILEIPTHASADEIRRAYRTEMSKYHPDKVASLGREFKSLAERKTKEINAAYSDAMKSKGVEP